jgi:hypothetical protein
MALRWRIAVSTASNSDCNNGDYYSSMEDIEMAPGSLFEIMGFTQLLALGTGKAGATVSAEGEMYFARSRLLIQVLSANVPGRFYPKAKEDNVITIHENLALWCGFGLL